MNDIIQSIEIMKCTKESNERMIADVSDKKLFGKAIDDAISALEKQIPKKPLNMSKQIDRQHDAKQNVGECPNCKNNIVAYAWFENTHCWVCGQAVDWSVEK